MSLESVSKDLNQRFEDSESWFESQQGLELSGLKLRGMPCTAKLVDVLDTPKRKERFGLAFHVTVESPSSSRTFQMNIRIKPDETEGKAKKSTPYVVVKLLSQSTGAEQDVVYIVWNDESEYVAWAKLEMKDWCRAWIARALDTGSGKFFAADAKIGSVKSPNR